MPDGAAELKLSEALSEFDTHHDSKAERALRAERQVAEPAENLLTRIKSIFKSNE